MSDLNIDVSPASQPSWWTRNSYYFFVMALALWVMQWALKQLGWLFGWSEQPRDGHLGQIFDALVILAAGTFLMIHAIRYLRRNHVARQTKLDELHEKLVRAREAKNLHA